MTGKSDEDDADVPNNATSPMTSTDALEAILKMLEGERDSPVVIVFMTGDAMDDTVLAALLSGFVTPVDVPDKAADDLSPEEFARRKLN
jgi:CheY-like chemotaxis protein